MITKQRVKAWLERNFLLRLHMTFILGGTFFAGLAATKLLLALGLESPPLRYGLAVVLAYGVFVVLIRLWLTYVGATNDSGFDLSLDGIQISPSADDVIPIGGGGNFGGGGATGSWGDAQSVVSAPQSSGGGGSWLPSIDVDGDELVVVILFIALVAALLFAGIYIIWSAPAILAEAAFEAMLALALARRAKKIDRAGWVKSVIRATVWPFVAILVLSVGLGWAVQRAQASSHLVSSPAP